MSPICAVTVYCSSRSCIPAVYFDAGRELGRRLVEAGWKLVYGGNRIGLMGALADAVQQAGGFVVGITPRLFVEKNCGDERSDELIVTDDMRQRKALLETRGDAFIALPGGLGTFEEIFEIIVGKLLGYHAKPIVLLDIAGYYGPLLAMIEHGIAQHFIKPATRGLFHVAGKVDEAIRFLRGDEAGDTPIPPSGEKVGAEPSAME